MARSQRHPFRDSACRRRHDRSLRPRRSALRRLLALAPKLGARRPPRRPAAVCFYNTKCVPTLESVEEQGAFMAPENNSDDKRDKVAELFALRQREGVSKRVSDGFVALARRWRARNPWRALISLPVATRMADCGWRRRARFSRTQPGDPGRACPTGCSRACAFVGAPVGGRRRSRRRAARSSTNAHRRRDPRCDHPHAHDRPGVGRRSVCLAISSLSIRSASSWWARQSVATREAGE